MSEYEVNWAVGGRFVVRADTPEEAQLQAKELLSCSDFDWQDIDLVPIEENSKIALG